MLEEIGIPFELIRYERHRNGQAPVALVKGHPLGKSPPVIIDGDLGSRSLHRFWVISTNAMAIVALRRRLAPTIIMS